MKTMQKTSQILLVLFLLCQFSSCTIRINDTPNPSFEQIRRDFYIQNFDQVNMGNAFQVNIYQGSNFKISTIGDADDIDDIEFYTRNGILYGRYKNYRSNRYTMKIDITMPTLRVVDFSNATNARIEGFDVRNLAIYLSGASRLNTDLDAQNLYLGISGASDLSMYGNSEKIIGEVSGASQLDNFNHLSDEINLKISGASKARISAIKFLRVEASGASSVRYKGYPVLEKSVSGGSSVERD
jgi:hypothetical protein